MSDELVEVHDTAMANIEKRIQRAKRLLIVLDEAMAIDEMAATRICSKTEAFFAVKAAQILLQAESDDK